MYGITSHLKSSSLQRVAEEQVGPNLLKYQCDCILYQSSRWVSQPLIDEGITTHDDQGTEEQPGTPNTMADYLSRITEQGGMATMSQRILRVDSDLTDTLHRSDGHFLELPDPPKYTHRRNAEGTPPNRVRKRRRRRIPRPSQEPRRAGTPAGCNLPAPRTTKGLPPRQNLHSRQAPTSHRWQPNEESTPSIYPAGRRGQTVANTAPEYEEARSRRIGLLLLTRLQLVKDRASPSAENANKLEETARGLYIPCPEHYENYCVHGKCEHPVNMLKPSCRCDAGYSGPQCEKKDFNVLYVVPGPVRFQYVLIAAVIGTVQIAIICIVVLCITRKCPRSNRIHRQKQNTGHYSSDNTTRASTRLI
ncbi:Tomoregulin-2 [Pelobates cultripes]|uniref:Tomoregulin-2, partial n=1 Tax=Pelobates cultripes TaxID=61616 RepID=A0AAD1SNI0_PELCU|nr:Tomoregulin-2 [Pelobates cultripes]